MTTELSTERDLVTSPVGEVGEVDVDRLCVAARSVLARMSDLVAEGLTSTGVEQTTRHAEVLADLRGLHALSLPALRVHAVAVHEVLIGLAGDQSLTLAVWFDDALGAGGSTAAG